MTVVALKTGSDPDFVALAETLGQQFAATAALADESDCFVADNYKVLKASPLVDAAVPRELGGGGADIATLGEMLRVMAHHCSSTALAFAMHTHLVTMPAWRWQHQKVAAVEPLLKRIAAEKLILATSGGSDWVAGSGRAERVEGGYRITARKIFASGCEAADLFMTSAVLEEEGQEPMVLHFGIPMSSPHIAIDQTWKTLGMRGTGSHDVIINGHVVPEAAVAARRKAGEWHPLWHAIATVAIPLIYSVYLGVAESAVNVALDLARKRRSDPALVALAGRMATALKGAELARQSMIETASRGIASNESVDAVMMGRNLCAHHAIAAVDLALETAGGAGFYRVKGLERRFRDIQGARFHPMQDAQQAQYAGAMALGLPVAKVF